MTKTLAHFVSYLFHPLLFPTYAALLIIFTNPYRYAQFDFKDTSLFIIILFITTFGFPVFSLIIMKMLRLIDDFKLKEKKQRIIPYITTGTFYLWAFMHFKPGTRSLFSGDATVSFMLLGAALSVFIAFFINIYRKISLHTLACGALIGVVMYTAGMAHYNYSYFLLASIFVGGIVGTSRLVLDAHQPREIYSGYFVGLFGQFFAFSFFV